MNRSNVVLGALLLVVGALTMFASAFTDSNVTLLAVAAASVAIAAGALLVGTAGRKGRPV